MRRQTKISPNWFIFKPEYYGISCIIIKCNCDDKLDTFFEKSKDCDGQEMGVWKAKRWESYRTIVSEMFNRVGSEFDSVIS